MNTYSATKAQKVFGELIMESQRAPVSVTRNGKPVAVVLSATDYQALKLQALRATIIEGEQSGDAGVLNMQAIKQKARQLAGLNT